MRFLTFFIFFPNVYYNYELSYIICTTSQTNQSNQRQGNFGLVSGADKDAVVFRERHQILLQGKDNKSGCVAYITGVLVLLYVNDETQPCTTHSTKPQKSTK